MAESIENHEVQGLYNPKFETVTIHDDLEYNGITLTPEEIRELIPILNALLAGAPPVESTPLWKVEELTVGDWSPSYRLSSLWRPGPWINGQ